MRDALLPPSFSDNPELQAAILHEREACAFLAECHSGLWDLATVEQIAANIRARGEDSRGEHVHLTPDRYGALLAAEGELQALKAKAAPTPAPETAEVREAIHRALTAVEGDVVSAYTKDPTDAAADAVMAVLTDLGVIPGEGGR